MNDQNLYWAFYIHKSEVKWEFGNYTLEFRDTVLGFLKGLSDFGEEISSEGIAAIEFTNPYSTSIDRLFIIRVTNEFLFIIYEPVVTLRLINALGGIPEEIEQQISGVIIGQAVIIYSNMYTRYNREDVDNLFQTALQKAYPEESSDKFIGKGICSLSLVPFEALIRFQIYLRELASNSPLRKQHPQWGLVVSLGGAVNYLSYNSPVNSVVLGGYLAVFVLFIDSLFKTRPKRLIFGEKDLICVDYVYGGDVILIIANPTETIQQGNFKEQFRQLNPAIQKMLERPVKEFIIDNIVLPKERQKLEQKTLEQVWNIE